MLFFLTNDKISINANKKEINISNNPELSNPPRTSSLRRPVRPMCVFGYDLDMNRSTSSGQNKEEQEQRRASGMNTVDCDVYDSSLDKSFC